MEGQEPETLGQESQPPAAEPVTLETNPGAAAESAAAALTQVKAAEVQALSDVLNVLQEVVSDHKATLAQLQECLGECNRMKDEIAQTLLEIQQEKEAQQQHPQQPTKKTGLAALNPLR